MKTINTPEDYQWYHKLRKNNDSILTVSSHVKENYDESIKYHLGLGYKVIEEYYITKPAQPFASCVPFWSSYMQKEVIWTDEDREKMFT
jgi:hypothetical protein